MSEEIEPSQRYFIDQERMEEMYRLAQQDYVLTDAMGGPLPERDNSFAGFSDILDLACGSGGWLLNVAQQYPDVRCVGVDLSERMVEFDQVQAEADELTNVTFRVANILQPLDFPNQSFDLINARLIFGFMSPHTWPGLLRECWRILRPGGMIRITDSEAAISTSPALSTWVRTMTEGMHRLGRTFSPDGRTLGTTAVLGKLLRSAGFSRVSNLAFAFEFSTGAPLHDSLCKDILDGARLTQPFLVQLGMSVSEFERLHQQMQGEMAADDFCGVWHYVTYSGKKSA